MVLISASLRRPITVLVIVVALVMAGCVTFQRISRDIFPSLGIPTIYVAQPFGGMDPGQMEGFLTYYYEYHFLYITGIEHVESKSIQGISLIKLQFHPGTDMAQAMAETIANVNRSRAFMPPGTVPPFVMRFDSGSVPVGNLVFRSDTRSVGELQDLALNKVRPLFATLQGVSAPPPFGGNQRSIVVNLKPERLQALEVTPEEVVAALTGSNLISPSGNVRVGEMIPLVPSNSLVSDFQELLKVPIRTGALPTVFLRDVATISDATDIVTGYALVNGRRTVYIPVTKRSDASTLAVVSLVKENLERFQNALPADVKVSYELDQSPYVVRAMNSVLFEGGLGAILTGLVVLLFLRDRRSALIVVVNIPLALLAALCALRYTGQTLNLMTLGGLALSIGILVDMSTVTIENLHTHLSRGKPLARGVVDSGREVALPLMVSTLCILAVFVPALLMTGVARALFTPLSLAVAFAMVAAYVLSATVVPVLAVMTMGTHQASDGPFERLRARYEAVISRLVDWRYRVLAVYAVVSLVLVVGLGSGLGTEIFPRVDSGQFQLRMRAPTGTRIERTEELALNVLKLIERETGDQVEMSLGFVGVQPPSYPINTIYLWTGGPEEAVLQIQLKPGSGLSTEDVKERLRAALAAQMPELRVSFEPSDIISRIMSLGAATPVEVAVGGPDLEANRQFAEQVRQALLGIPELRDVQIAQALDYPSLQVDVDRERAGLLGLTTTDVTRSLATATSSSRFVTPNFWRDPNSGIAYQVQVQIPVAEMTSAQDVESLPLKGSRGGAPHQLRELARVTPGTTVGEYNRYNMQRLVTVNVNQGVEDLGRTGSRVREALDQLGAPPPGVSVNVRGQLAPLQEMMEGLSRGLLLTVLVTLLLLAANFQSLRLALVVVAVVPAVLAGVASSLWLTGTTLNMQSFMGAIMAVGVAVANAILLVTFAERCRLEGLPAGPAGVRGAASRLRPILMTSLAMLAGMLPMALGLGEGGEQVAPLGRAVVGGLIGATAATLGVLPGLFATIQEKSGRDSASLDPDDPSSRHFELTRESLS